MTDLKILESLVELKKEDLDYDTIIGESDDGKAIRMEDIHSLNLSNTRIFEIPGIIGRLVNLKSLNVSGTPLTSLPESIGVLRNLQELDISGTRLTSLPKGIGNLSRLKSLNASDTRIIFLPEEIGFLSNLETLDISGTQITSLPDRIGFLQWLQKLNVSRTQLTSLPNSIGNLRNLQILDVSGTQLTCLPESIGKMEWLQTLDASGTELVALPENIGTMEWLQNLNVSKTNLAYLPDSIGKLWGLLSLDVSDTKLTSLPFSLGNLHSLQRLNASELKISELPGSIRELRNLEILNISRTNVNDIRVLTGLLSLKSLNLQDLRIDTIPDGLLDLNLMFITKEYNGNEWEKYSGIFIHNLVLSNQPIEIFLRKNELIRANLEETRMVPINECKVIFLGDAESGKTHSLKRLLNNGEYIEDFDGELTPGIEIEISPLKLSGSEIVVNYWDFGGQEIQHSMHRVFLTERTVYVMFLNARQDDLMDERAKYWMENIKAFAPDAPVLVVINKIDQNEHPRFNEKGFIDSYGEQVKKVIRLSAKTDEKQAFLEKLQGNINSIIMDMPTVRKMIPRSWKNLMENIRVMSDFYLTTDQFMEKCQANRIKNYEEIHDELVDLFQIIGVSFCYYKNRSVADYMLLNPKWMLNALYTIVTNGKAVAQNGVITQDNLYDLLEKDAINGITIRRVVPKLRYKGFEVNYILGVIRMFGLSYSLQDGSEFFPMLCDGDEKISVKDAVPEDALHFIFRYTYLPTNIMHRLIVEMQRDLDYRYVWYTGAVFKNTQQKQTAYIHSLGNDLHIYVYGEDKYYNFNEYLTPITNIVRNINKSMGLSAVEYLTFRKNGVEAEIALDEVRGNILNGINKIYNAKLNEVISLEELAHRYPITRLSTDDLLKSVVNALHVMQRDKIYSSSDENARNRFVSAHVTAQLKGTGIVSADQQKGGTSSTGKGIEERDIVIKDEIGQEILIYEGLNLKSLNKAYLDKHIDKVLKNYNPQGLRYSILVTYLECDRDRFKSFIDDYKAHIAEYAPESYSCNGKPEEVSFDGEFLRCMKMQYEAGGIYFTIYHIIVRMGQ